MIDRNVVSGIVNEWLEDKDYFLVDVSVSPDDKIVVEIDHAEGVWIDDCVELSRFIESKLDREEEDYELEVGSAGIGEPFKVLQQYLIHIGKEVEVLTRAIFSISFRITSNNYFVLSYFLKYFYFKVQC